MRNLTKYAVTKQELLTYLEFLAPDPAPGDMDGVYVDILAGLVRKHYSEKLVETEQMIKVRCSNHNCGVRGLLSLAKAAAGPMCIACGSPLLCDGAVVSLPRRAP